MQAVRQSVPGDGGEVAVHQPRHGPQGDLAAQGPGRREDQDQQARQGQCDALGHGPPPSAPAALDRPG